MQNLSLLFVVVVVLHGACSQRKTEIPVSSAPAPVEMGDSAKAALCKASYAALIAGDVDGFTASMSDNAVFSWNAGDSIVGKAAIIEYWKDRRANVINQLGIKDDVWLPLKVNSVPNQRSGEYVMMWATLASSYQFGGKTMARKLHQVYHFNNDGKIDYVGHYLDQHDMAEAVTGR